VDGSVLLCVFLAVLSSQEYVIILTALRWWGVGKLIFSGSSVSKNV